MIADLYLKYLHLEDFDSYIQQITDAGITVDNTYDFQDLRGGQEGTSLNVSENDIIKLDSLF